MYDGRPLRKPRKALEELQGEAIHARFLWSVFPLRFEPRYTQEELTDILDYLASSGKPEELINADDLTNRKGPEAARTADILGRVSLAYIDLEINKALASDPSQEDDFVCESCRVSASIYIYVWT